MSSTSKGGGGVPPSPTPPAPSGKTILTLLSLTGLLMIFSVVSWLLGNPTLAATAGLGAVGLVGETARRLLSSGPFAGPGGQHGTLAQDALILTGPEIPSVPPVVGQPDPQRPADDFREQ